MAREWQPVPSLDLVQRDVTASEGEHSAPSESPQRVARTWSLDRGAVLWEGVADLQGSFPGFAQRGSRAQDTHLTLTDRFLLVDECGDGGFGLPIGWLSAAQALTGVEPIALESGDRLRVCYVDGNRVRGFLVRIRGGRFGRNASRRANLLRSAAMTLGLASSAPSTDLLLPPEHDLTLGWDDFASHENEPVIWTGRATMPVANGLDPARCDVWLTSESLIWGANSRAGIFRLPTASLTGITVARTAGPDAIVYWSLSGTHHTQVDLPMVFTRQDRKGGETAPEQLLLKVLEEHGYRLGQPATPTQPWRTAPQGASSSPEPNGPATAAEASPAVASRTGEPAQAPPATVVPSNSGSEPVEGSRRRLLDDGLFPERTVPSLPRSTPLPWGNRVERIDEERPPTTAPKDGGGLDAQPREPSPPSARVIAGPGKLRIRPQAAPHSDSAPSTGDAAALLVRRPPVRAATTDEFLRAERAARSRAASALAAEGQSTVPVPVEPATRGVLVRFRSPGSTPSDRESDRRRADARVPVALSPSLAIPSAPSMVPPAAGDRVSGSVSDGDTGESGHPLGQDAVQAPMTDKERLETPEEPILPGQPRTTAQAAVPVMPEADVLADIGAQTVAVDVPGAPMAPTLPDPGSGSGAAHLPALDRMRTILTLMDAQLAQAIARFNDPSHRSDQPDASPMGALLRSAMDELDHAVRVRQLSTQAAQTHRQAIMRTADTTERLRSLLDLYGKGYLTAAELMSRRESLLGRTRPES